MKVVPITGNPAAMIDLDLPAGTRVRLGRIVFRAGERAPPEGVSQHEQAEYSYLISGCIKVTSGGQTAEARTGDFISIPPGESHFTEVAADSSVVYLLIG